MFANAPGVIEISSDNAQLEADLEALPNTPAVFVIWPREGEPYLAKTSMLRRRLKRLLRPRAQPSRLLNLRAIAVRVEFWHASDGLGTLLVTWELARRYLPGSYLKLLKLRMPAYVKILLGNRFPRSQVTTKISAGPGLYYGPFRARAGAELFEHDLLDLFQLRRCQEDLDPSPIHPGCIYGEMNMCLRPCQQVVGVSEYASEAARVAQFLQTDGQVALKSAQEARDRLSAEMEFEQAARQHKQLERIEQVIKLRDDLVRDIDRLSGIAVTRSTHSDEVILWPVTRGVWQPQHHFAVGMTGDQPLSLDARLRHLVASLEDETCGAQVRQEHLALLARWYYSSWREGEFIFMESREKAPYRKLVNAISRVSALSRTNL